MLLKFIFYIYVHFFLISKIDKILSNVGNKLLEIFKIHETRQHFDENIYAPCSLQQSYSLAHSNAIAHFTGAKIFLSGSTYNNILLIYLDEKLVYLQLLPHYSG